MHLLKVSWAGKILIKEKMPSVPMEEETVLPLKILHTGDLHLGMTYRSRGYPETLRESLVEARFETLKNLVEKANQEDCQLFVVAGDLFHRTNVSQETVLKTVKILSNFNGNCVAVLPGNHDFLEDYGPLWGSFRENAFDNLLLLADTVPYTLEDFNLDAVLYPAPCHRKHSEENRLGWIPELEDRPPGQWHLGVAHGSVRGISPDFDAQYFPMEGEELRELGLHHWCLGHTHVRYPDLDRVGGCPFAYCGTPEPDGFDCSHGGYARITVLDDLGNPESLSISTGGYRFIEMQKEISGVGELEELGRTLEPQGENTLLKLSLSGTLSQEDYLCRAQIYDKLGEILAYLEVEDSRLNVEITPQTISAEFPDGSFPHRLLNRLAEKEEDQALQLAYQLIKKVKK